MSASAQGNTVFSISTHLPVDDRPRVDAVSKGLCDALHRDSLDAVLEDVRSHRAHAVVFSVARYGILPTARLATIVREFPQVPAIALLSRDDAVIPQAVMSLGHIGVRTLIDVRSADGWSRLRSVLMSERSGELEREVLAQLAVDLAGVPKDCWRFFQFLFSTAPRILTVRDLASNLRVLPSTLLSRFFRAKLPPPKRYLSLARLIRAARLFENPGFSVAAVANHLEYSSPQSFGRHLRTMMGMSPVTFRHEFDARAMTDYFRERLVTPHLETLRRFRPVETEPSWIRPTENFRPRYETPVAKVAERPAS